MYKYRVTKTGHNPKILSTQFSTLDSPLIVGAPFLKKQLLPKYKKDIFGGNILEITLVASAYGASKNRCVILAFRVYPPPPLTLSLPKLN